MKWEQGTGRDVPDIIDFLLPKEYACVSLTSKFTVNDRPVWPDGNPTVGLLKHNGTIEGVVFISARGLALPVITPEGVRKFKEHFPPLFLRKPLKKVHTIIGEKSIVETLEHYKDKKRNDVEYRLMVQKEEKKYIMKYDNVIRCVRAGPEHRDLLFELHKGYAKEEVLLEPEKFNSQFQRDLLEKKLSSQIFYYAEYENKPVGTAGTNALGFSWCQLGSIYTEPTFRKQGIASVLVSALCREIRDRGKKACLFAKTDNRPALELYRGLGFTVVTDYKISYFFR